MGSNTPQPVEQVFQNFDMQPLVYSSSQWVTVPRNCNGFIVTNRGDTIVQVNDQILYPGVPGTTIGDSISFGGNRNEIYVGKVKISFNTPLGVAPLVEVVFKLYVP